MAGAPVTACAAATERTCLSKGGGRGPQFLECSLTILFTVVLVPLAGADTTVELPPVVQVVVQVMEP